MKLYSIKIGDKSFRVAVANTPEKMKEGLSGKPKLGKGKGLLFPFMEERKITMNMGGMFHPIDMIFVNSSKEVIKVANMKVGDKDITVPNTMAVIDVAEGGGKGLKGKTVECSEELMNYIKGEVSSSNNIIVTISSIDDRFRSGGTIDIKEDKVKADKKAMQVLDDKGVILMNIKGGERIFSIKHTEQLVSLAKKISEGKAEEEELGMLMSNIIHTQNTQEKQYV